MLFLLLSLLLPPVQTYRLAVVGGTGSGVYACGADVKIDAPKAVGDRVFDIWHAGWDGDTKFGADGRRKRKTRIVMPCRDVKIEARYTPKPPKGKR